VSLDVFVVGVGARTAAGLTPLQVTMMARAGKSFPRESHLRDRTGAPIGTCRLSSIADNVHGFRRFLALGGPPLAQAAQPWVSALLARREQLRPLPVVLALPSLGRPGFDSDLRARLLPALQERSGIELDLARSTLVTECRAGGVLAMKHAVDLISSGNADAVLVGGIDSYFDPDALEWLDRELRLHGPATENGFVPGEGAAFVLLASRRGAGSLPRWCRVLGVGTAEEPRPYGHEEPCQAHGMSRAIRAATEGASLARARSIGWLLTDVANERHRVDEWQMASGRLFHTFTEDAIHDQPLLETGDVGAASATMLTVLASVRWQTGCGRADRALVATHSDGPLRGAIVLGAEATS
jgi:3-oxoacyl-[acyl-carrier-protein] synthase-1